MTAKRLVPCQWIDPGKEMFECEGEFTAIEVFTDAVVFEQHDGSRQVYDIEQLASALGLRVEDVRRRVA